MATKLNIDGRFVVKMISSRFKHAERHGFEIFDYDRMVTGCMPRYKTFAGAKRVAIKKLNELKKSADICISCGQLIIAGKCSCYQPTLPRVKA